MKYSIFVFFLFFFCSCDKNPNCPEGSHSYITISNESDKKIYYDIPWNYPDTTVGKYSAVAGKQSLMPNENFKYSVSPNGSDGCWEEIFMKAGKENIYFFDSDIVQDANWEDIRKTNRGLLERRVIDLEYCQKNNWEIIYK